MSVVVMTLATGPGMPARAQPAGRLIDIIDAVRRDDHVNITIQFSCTMRYISHLPANTGVETQIRFRPGPDCGLGPSPVGVNDLPSLAGVDEYLKELRVDAGAPGEVNLTATWRKESTYVVAPTGDQRGFVIRLIDALPKGHAYIQETVVPNATFAVNLESRRTSFEEAEIAAASRQFKTTAYVSTIELDGIKWYRLRVGPMSSRNDAEQLLSLALTSFPRAWLVIGEEEATASGEGGVTLPPAAPPIPDPALPAEERAQILAKAKSAMAARDYKSAVESLTILVRQPEYAERAESQELLGLSRERSGQLAHAKAEYEEYLRRYPKGPAAERIRARLKALALAGRNPRTVSASGSQIPVGWSYSGGLAQLYRRDQNNVASTGVAFNQTSQNAIINNADFLARRRGEGFDFLGRIYAGYTKDLLKGPAAPGDQTQLNAAFVELTDKKIDLTGRLGRQSRGSDGVFGTFDGAWISYKIAPRVTINTTFGYPVDVLNEGVRTNREFAGLAADFGTFFRSWDFSTYAIEQKYSGAIDRRAVGIETRYFQPGRSLIALIDYDTFFKTLNSATVIGGITLPASWTLSFNFDRRDTPILTLRNALIGQPVSTIDALSANFTPAQIVQLARDRTATNQVYAVTLTRPIAEKFQISADTYLTTVGPTPASGNVPAGPASGTDRALQFQLFGTSLWRSADLHVLSLRYDTNPTAVTESIGISSRMPIWGNWRIGPRLEVDRIRYESDQSTEMGYLPSVRLELLRSRAMFEFEVGADKGRRQVPLQVQSPLQVPLPVLLDTQTSTQFYFSLGYRLGF
jgi:tetratricopeptide (TPR) repeat protein